MQMSLFPYLPFGLEKKEKIYSASLAHLRCCAQVASPHMSAVHSCPLVLLRRNIGTVQVLKLIPGSHSVPAIWMCSEDGSGLGAAQGGGIKSALEEVCSEQHWFRLLLDAWFPCSLEHVPKATQSSPDNSVSPFTTLPLCSSW